MIDQKLIKDIQESLSKEPKIIAAYVLGSVISGKARSDSDFDLAVVVEDKNKTTFDQVYDLISLVSFPKNLDLSVIDKSSSPLFLFQMISTGNCVYKRSQEDKIAIEAFVLKNYYDTAHIRKIYYSYLKEKFPYANQ